MTPSPLASRIDRAQRGGPHLTPAPRRELTIRKASGKPSWPLVLLAGVAKAGKSYSIGELATSPLINRLLWIEAGESAAELYAGMDGSKADPVEWDGTFEDLCAVAQACVDAPPGPDGQPNAIALDSFTEVWDMLTAEQQLIAADRTRGRDTVDAPLDWSTAKARWRDLLSILRQHNGPVILTARLEQITTSGADGRPNGEREKIRAEKNLPYEVDLLVYLPQVREHWIGGVQSLKLRVPEGGWLRYEGFTLASVFEDMGVTEAGATTSRHYTATRPEAALS